MRYNLIGNKEAEAVKSSTFNEVIAARKSYPNSKNWSELKRLFLDAFSLYFMFLQPLLRQNNPLSLILVFDITPCGYGNVI